MNEPEDIKDMSFEEALQELERIVKRIDNGQETLESSLKSFERGSILRDHCMNKLENAKLKIEQITKLNNKDIKIEEIKI